MKLNDSIKLGDEAGYIEWCPWCDSTNLRHEGPDRSDEIWTGCNDCEGSVTTQRETRDIVTGLDIPGCTDCRNWPCTC